MIKVLACVLLAAAWPAFSHDGAADDVVQTLGFDEKPGAYIPLDLTLADENGRRVKLADYITAPTVLSFVYFRCANACALLPTNLAQTLSLMSGEPGRDYKVLTVSFDPTDGPVQARDKKKLALSMLPAGFPADDWLFATGDPRDIEALTDAVGFHYAKRGDDFDHPLGLVVVSPRGRIARYLRGMDFLASDLRLATMEASNERFGAAVGKLLRYCLTYDPKSNRMALDIIKVGGAVTLSFAAALVVWLLATGRRRQKKEARH
jgi:protein SCO1